jgi:hydroxymethylbilane synthase
MQMASEITEKNPIILASRASRLALIQTEEVRTRLAPLASSIVSLSTRGDEVLDRSLANIGGKGLFVKALEEALTDGRADAAVHSAKDMETRFTDGTVIAAFLEREDRRDALVGPYDGVDDLPQGAVVGTASVRREAILRALRPDIKIKLLRGNVQTRIQQLAAGQYDAIILAMAGLNRLVRNGDSITEQINPLDETNFLPAAAQGVIAIQAIANDGSTRRMDVLEALSRLNHTETAAEAIAERSLLDQLAGTCQTPVGATAHLIGNCLHLSACLLSRDGQSRFDVAGEAGIDDAEVLGRTLADDLLNQAGGRYFLTREGSS